MSDVAASWIFNSTGSCICFGRISVQLSLERLKKKLKNVARRHKKKTERCSKVLLERFALLENDHNLQKKQQMKRAATAREWAEEADKEEMAAAEREG
jgi:signal transduction protein with GAF and PtsI domain